ncbi:succinate dehydrogenase cytochrome b subunit [Desulfolithobacter sp.]
MSWFTSFCNTSVGKKYIMASTGLLLGGFLLVHAAGNSSIFWGRDAFLSYAEHLHALGPFISVFEIILLTVFSLHVVTGLALALENIKARSSRYVAQHSAGGRTIGSRTMPYTGLVILGFIWVHLQNVHFTDHRNTTIADIVSTILVNPAYTVLYSLGLLALTLHISHGFWSMFQSIGLNHPRYDRLIRVSAWIGCGLIISIFFVIVLLLISNRNWLGQLA